MNKQKQYYLATYSANLKAIKVIAKDTDLNRIKENKSYFKTLKEYLGYKIIVLEVKK